MLRECYADEEQCNAVEEFLRRQLWCWFFPFVVARWFFFPLFCALSSSLTFLLFSLQVVKGWLGAETGSGDEITYMQVRSLNTSNELFKLKKLTINQALRDSSHRGGILSTSGHHGLHGPGMWLACATRSTRQVTNIGGYIKQMVLYISL